MKSNYLFTSESVSEGHPDKVADQISDAVLDAILAQDPRSRVAAETLCNTGLVVMAGEITTNAHVDYIQVARDTIRRIGYDNTAFVSPDGANPYRHCQNTAPPCGQPGSMLVSALMPMPFSKCLLGQMPSTTTTPRC